MVGRQYRGYVQNGKGGFSVFRGSRMQRGYGIGSVLSSMRAAVPFLRRGAQALGKQARRVPFEGLVFRALGRGPFSQERHPSARKTSPSNGTRRGMGRFEKTETERFRSSAHPADGEECGREGWTTNGPATTRSEKWTQAEQQPEEKKGIKRKAPSKSVISSRAKRGKRPPDIFDR